MSDSPLPHDPSATEAASRRSTPAACPDPRVPPVAGPEQGTRGACGPSPVPANECSEEVARTLEGLATPHPAAPTGMPRSGRARGGRGLRPARTPPSPLTAEQRLLLLDTWQRSKLPAGDFAALVGLSKHTLYAWNREFRVCEQAGCPVPVGLEMVVLLGRGFQRTFSTVNLTCTIAEFVNLFQRGFAPEIRLA